MNHRKMSFHDRGGGHNGPTDVHSKQADSAPGPIQYVFIDESQRDGKRLKITRACESCRRRKVKCDAPHVAPGDSCTSCRRLRIECVLQQTGQDATFDDRMGLGRGPRLLDVRTPRTVEHDSAIRDFPSRRSTSTSPRSTSGSDTTYQLKLHDATPYSRVRRRTSTSSLFPGPQSGGAELGSFPSKASASMTPLTDPKTIRGVDTLTAIFGKLNIAIGGRAMFLRDNLEHKPLSSYDSEHFGLQLNGPQEKCVPGFPVAFETIENHLPPEDLAIDLINLFFHNVHPYIPVLNKASFYRDWSGPNRRTMSPYLLLSFFAAAARYSEDPRVRNPAEDLNSRGDRWYDLVLLYREDFHDAPRTSTIQADVINLKSLESRPKVSGYFYRCWFLLSCIIRMGKDLGLHRMTEQLEYSAESITGRRIWQICLIMDQLMGTALGRELQLNMAEVDLTLLPESLSPAHGLNSAEVRLQNDFVYLTGLIKILRRCTEVHSIVGIKFPFSAEPQYPALSDILTQWRATLPAHLAFNPLVDKVLPSHFTANLNLTYYMIVCVLHRPWIVSVGEYGASGEWRIHLSICNDVARQALALYEMTLNQYGEAGFMWMIRGNNFALYGAIIMTMIHAVCLTCPEQCFSEGARDQLNRSLAVLERLSKSNPQVQFEKQLSAIRGMFSKTGRNQFSASDISDLQNDPVANAEGRQDTFRDASFSHPVPPFRPSFTYRPSVPTEQHPGSRSSAYVTMPNHGSSFYQSIPMSVPAPISLETSSQGLASTMDSSPQSAIMSPPMGTSWNPAGLIGAWNQTFPMASSGMDYASQFLMQGNMLQAEHDGPLIPTAQLDPYFSHSQSVSFQQAFPEQVPQQLTPHHHHHHQQQQQQPSQHTQYGRY